MLEQEQIRVVQVKCHIHVNESFKLVNYAMEDKMSNYRRDQLLLEILGKMRAGDSAATEEIRAYVSDVFFWKQGCLAIVDTEIEGVLKCFTYTASQVTSFYLPGAFGVKTVYFSNGKYHFLSVKEITFSASLEQLQSTWQELPFGGNRLTRHHVERAFEDCNKPHDTHPHHDARLGLFSYAYGMFTREGGAGATTSFATCVHVPDRHRLVASIPLLQGVIDDIDTYDNIARKELAKAFSPTPEELASLHLGMVDFFESGEFDLTYALPEGTAVEYVRVCFSTKGEPVETTAGNF